MEVIKLYINHGKKIHPSQEFVADFDITKINPKVTYKKFIEDLRNNKILGKTFSHDIPVLAPQEKTPTRWFHVVLRTDEKEITLSIRCDNLYLVGYQMGKAGTWMEFGSVAHSPSFLGFGCEYGDLENAAGVGTSTNKSRNSIELGQRALKDAVNDLANSSIERALANSYEERKCTAMSMYGM
uniref:rRNA N-glycosylase n=1 Tax=Fagus sylvatica TaxID=28930 RepID=A0A2N9IXB6_FAGSY